MEKVARKDRAAKVEKEKVARKDRARVVPKEDPRAAARKDRARVVPKEDPRAVARKDRARVARTRAAVSTRRFAARAESLSALRNVTLEPPVQTASTNALNGARRLQKYEHRAGPPFVV